MRVYHFVPYGFGLEDLRHRRLKIARLDELNDPFELLGFAAREPTIRKAFAETKAKLAQDRGMLCFSRDWHNPVQWSHYAEQHRGLCLGFDIPDAMLTEVAYTSKRPLPDMATLAGKGPKAQAEMIKVLATKFTATSTMRNASTRHRPLALTPTSPTACSSPRRSIWGSPSSATAKVRTASSTSPRRRCVGTAADWQGN